MKAHVIITLKPGLLDAQGKTIKSALDALGFTGIHDVRVGKYLEVDLDSHSEVSARKELERMCQKLLANPVVETYRIELTNGSPSTSLSEGKLKERKGKAETRRRGR